MIDSPSRQLLLEMGIQTDVQNRAFHASLDEKALRLEKEHRLALAAATLEHERVREGAERAHQLVQLQLEWERQMQVDEEKQILEREQKALMEREIAGKKRELLEAERLRELKRIAAEAQESAERARIEAARIPEPTPAPKIETIKPVLPPASTSTERASIASSQTNGNSPTQKLNSISITGAQAPSSSLPSSGQAIPQAPTPAITTITSTPLLQGSARSKHHQYLEVHQRLKQLRKTVNEMQDKELKKKTGEYRREIKKSVGQLTVDMKANTAPYNKIRDILNESAKLQQPQLDIRSYLVGSLPPNAESLPGSAGLIQTYLLNIFCKAVISQFVNEAGVAPRAAEPIGTVAIRIFAAPEFKWQGVSLIDILLAKFHAVCPILFGVYGRSPATKKQKRGEALSGLGAGFAALSLRDFGKSTMQNPFPPSNYWQALACVINSPPKETTEEHFIVLKAMIEHHTERFIRFYGQAALLALRKAIVEFPQQSPKSVASSSLSTLQVTLKRDINLSL